MRFASLFLWIVLPAAAYFIYVVYGLPHFIWSYRFHHNGDPHNSRAERYYVDCTFVGPYGRFTVSADAGRCGWIKFFTPSADQ